MNINLGNYLESAIRSSTYSKKELCNKLNELYTFGDKPLSYSTFSNNVKNGEITFNELIAIATLIETININKVVIAYKNKLNKTNNKGEVLDMKKSIVEILKDNSIEGFEYKEENIHEICKYDTYEALHLSDDLKTASLERVYINDTTGYVQELALFTNFDEVLGENGLSTKEYLEMPLNEKIDFLAEEGRSALEILGEDMKEVDFNPKNYFND